MKYVNSKNRQNGMATILIVLLVGISMTAIAMGLAGSVKSTQEKQTSVHAATHAQSAAWSAVHIFKEYLKGLEYDDVSEIVVGSEIPMSVDSSSQSLSASIVDVDNSLKDIDSIRVTVNIKAFDAAAKASSAIQVVYRIVNAVCDICQSLNGQVDLYDDTYLGGDIKIQAPAGVPTSVNVDGSIDATSISLIGVTYLNSTGDITLGSAVPIEQIYSNGNIILNGSANVAKASALGIVEVHAGAKADYIYANSDVVLDGQRVTAANTRGDAKTIQWANHGAILAMGNVEINTPVEKVHARGDINLKQWADALDIATEGNLTCPGTSWTNFNSLVAEISLVNCPAISATVKQGVDISIPIMEELQPFVRSKPVVDVWTVKDSANYVFEYVSGKIQVTVKNINSISDGVYQIGDFPDSGGRGHKNYLCDVVDSSTGMCTSPAALTRTICQGYSTSDRCISYDISTDTWTIGGKNVAPGVLWFDGNLNLYNGEYYNTFAVTKQITTSGAMKTYSPNYIGFNAICSLTFPTYPTADYADMYPTQLCNMDDSTMTYSPLTNIVLMAGGNNPNAGGVYQGGDISLGASNELFGTILAGNNLDTGGSTVVHGYVSASANAPGSGTNDLGGSTTVILDNLPANYRPDEIPNFDGNSCVSSCAPPTSAAEVMWSRYL